LSFLCYYNSLFDSFVSIQGTLRPDLIESANADVGGAAHVIKKHHNHTARVREQRCR
jgi:GMP synthase PP-ATPase subunit